MANAATGWYCTHDASIIAQTNTTATIRVTCYWQNDGWNYNVNGVYAYVYCNGTEAEVKSGDWVDSRAGNHIAVSCGYHDFTVYKGTGTQNISCYARINCTSSYSPYNRSSSASSVSVSAKPSYTVSYNANGGTGAPGNQTKWYDTNLTLSSTKPTKTGHNFVRWNTNTSNTGTAYNPGATYTGNAGLTLYAIWTPVTYTVSYNANGGTGAPGNQTKTYGVNLTLSTTKPTKTNYNFKGWSTSANGSVNYASGATYTNNSAITLYAVWELAYVKPRINNFTANRCTSGGTVSESGTYLKVAFSWDTDKTVSAIKAEYKLQTASSWTSTAITASGTSGSVTQVIGSGGISTESSYHVRVYVTDSGGTTYSIILSIGTVKFPIDVKSGGKGVAVGKVAETDNLFDVNWNSRFRGNVVVDGNIQAFTRVVSQCGSDTANTKGWYKVASQTMSGYDNLNILYYIKAGYNAGYYGLLEFEMRSSNTSIACWECRWIARQGFATDSVRVVISGMTWTLYVYNPSNQYGRIYFSEIQRRGIKGDYYDLKITYYNSTTKESTDPTTSYNATDAGYISSVLYNNTSGSNGTITLSKSAANFSYLEIFYCDNNNRQHQSKRINSPNGKSITLSNQEPNDSDGGIHQRTSMYNISGTSISFSHAAYMHNWTDGKGLSTTAYNKIVKVLGYY